MFGIDVNYLQVKVNEGALLPTVTVQASVQQAYEQTLTIFRSVRRLGDRAGFGSGLSGRRRIFADPPVQGNAGAAAPQSRTDPRPDPRQHVTAWGQLVAGKAQVASAQSQVTASEIALNGVREEAKAGQRTTLDVLNAQQALVNARVALVTAQHDRVVASYAVLNAVGRLSPQVLKLATTRLRPERALPAGARQLGRRSHARRPLIVPCVADPALTRSVSLRVGMLAQRTARFAALRPPRVACNQLLP